MTPFFRSHYAATIDQPDELLFHVTADTQRELNRWHTFSNSLSNSRFLPRRAQRQVASVAEEALQVLHGMVALSTAARRAYRKRKLARSIRALNRFAMLRETLEVLNLRAASIVFSALSERSSNGRRA